MLIPNESNDRLLANLNSGKPSMCAYVFSHPNMVEVAGLAGFECFMADMMFTAHDWDNIAHMVRELMGLKTDWHRLIHLKRFATAEDFPEFARSVAESTLIIPTVESEGGLRDLDEIFALDGIRLVWLAAGDISKMLGVPFKYEHPKVLSLVEGAVKTAQLYGAGVMYNLGLDSPDFDSMAASAKRFFEMGVQVVGIGAMEWHMQMALEYVRKKALG